jgi:hypothetical protein
VALEESGNAGVEVALEWLFAADRSALLADEPSSDDDGDVDGQDDDSSAACRERSGHAPVPAQHAHAARGGGGARSSVAAARPSLEEALHDLARDGSASSSASASAAGPAVAGPATVLMSLRRGHGFVHGLPPRVGGPSRPPVGPAASRGAPPARPVAALGSGPDLAAAEEEDLVVLLPRRVPLQVRTYARTRVACRSTPYEGGRTARTQAADVMLAQVSHP